MAPFDPERFGEFDEFDDEIDNDFEDADEQADDSASAGDPPLAFLLLEKGRFPLAEFASRLSAVPIAGSRIESVSEPDRGIVQFEWGDEVGTIALFPMPYPGNDLEGPIHTSLLWPDDNPISSVLDHGEHLLIALHGGGGDPIRRRLFLTALTAAAAEEPGVLAVFWTDAMHLVHPSIFVDLARDIERDGLPPVFLWLDLRVFRNSDGTIGAFTTGMQPLGFMEIEIPRIDMSPGELREWILDIAVYLIENGPVLGDGHTIGRAEERLMRVHHRPSQFGHEGPVLCLEPCSAE